MGPQQKLSCLPRACVQGASGHRLVLLIGACGQAAWEPGGPAVPLAGPGAQATLGPAVRPSQGRPSSHLPRASASRCGPGSSLCGCRFPALSWGPAAQPGVWPASAAAPACLSLSMAGLSCWSLAPGRAVGRRGEAGPPPVPQPSWTCSLAPINARAQRTPPPHAEVGLASGTLPGGRRSEPLLRLLLSLACEVRESPSAPAGPPADQAAGVEAGPGSRLGPGCLCRSSNRPWPPPAGRPSRSEQRGRTEARGGSFLRLCPRGQAKFLAWGHVPGVLVLLGAAGPAGVPALLVEQGPCLVVSRTRWGWRKRAICKRPHGPAPVSLGPLAPSWPCARHSRSAVTGLVPVSRASRHPAPGLVGHRPLGSPRALPPE